MGSNTTTDFISHSQRAEIEEHRAQDYTTRRATVPALEDVIYDPIPVLDHGFVRLIDYMGDDVAIVQAARVSYGRGTRRVSRDRGLIRYLMRHRHTTPFEMCELKLHVKLPIFVARQWIRHRTANVNEYSARYSILDREFYIPNADALATQSSVNRQGRDEQLSAKNAARVQQLLRTDAERLYSHYEELLDEGACKSGDEPAGPGLARELARINLSLNYYTQWYWKIDLHNLLHFLSLRTGSHAQHEIREYAKVILEQIVKHWVPITYEAFCDYRLNSGVLSGRSLALVRTLVRGHREEAETLRERSGIASREWRELMEMLEFEE